MRPGLMRLWAALLLTVGLVSCQDPLCVLPCRCSQNIVNCTSGNIGILPDTIPDLAEQLILNQNNIRTVKVFASSSTLRNISLRHNLISKIEAKAFEKLYNLTYLDLSHNLISSDCLKPITFKGPETQSNTYSTLSLKVLNLASNTLHTLHQDLFEYLSDLEELYLGSNPFKVLDQGTMVALSSIHKIKVLDLSSTQLSTIPSTWLNAAKNLEIINLSMNNLVTVPDQLEEARSLRHLILDNNPITVISSFPKLPSLEVLQINWMQKLTAIKAHSLTNLTKLKELYVSNNAYLYTVSEDTLVEPGSYAERVEGSSYPPLEKLVLRDNRLSYLEERLVERWDKLILLDAEANPWMCDCKNQWILARLIPLMKDKAIGSPETFICGAPVEMKGMSMVELAKRNYEMRCLDLFGNEPDKDAKVLIVVLVVVLIAIPVSLLFLHLLKRPRGSNGYPTAYYRKAHSFESIN